MKRAMQNIYSQANDHFGEFHTTILKEIKN